MTHDASLEGAVRLLLAEARARATDRMGRRPADLVTIGLDDRETLAAIEVLEAVGARTFDDAVPRPVPSPDTIRRADPGAALLADARVVLLRLPKSLAALEELSGLVRTHARPDAILLGTARTKHLSPGANGVLAADFASVSASLGRWKSRVLVAEGARPGPPARSFPLREHVGELGFDVVAHGGAFAGPRLDLGTRVLLDVLDRATVETDAVGTVLDLGCGTGVLATSIARRRPSAEIIASDRSWAASASARATVDAAGVGARVTVRQEDAAAGVPDTSVDLVLLNPPFHEGHAVEERLADRLFEAAARVLRPGGRLLTVYNSHLRHRAALERIVGRTSQLERTSKFTVTSSVRR
ncbi:16S rRNA (guanine1207-N2)-methyltransferase [Pseudoclavibacter chungangensis]|uniref:class I SAM-dependent methyltransferase n=1 Tax=Pseudoclavibacter chungangensis TaxID=587635 RepID=UPI0015CB4AEE|nr:methyltransferase [Pseudoclavibacter chungangensis]NYJ68484.1 16S rRNA (guanine1207-N2)-methyltransferase [Pseudoclavibacter chungangensis]